MKEERGDRKREKSESTECMEIWESCDSTIKLVEFCSWRGVVPPNSPLQPPPLPFLSASSAVIYGLIRLIFTHPSPFLRGAFGPSPNRLLSNPPKNHLEIAVEPPKATAEYRFYFTPCFFGFVSAASFVITGSTRWSLSDLSARIKYSPPRVLRVRRSDLPLKKIVVTHS